MTKKGWITLHRKLQDNTIWRAEKFTKGQAWVDLLLRANHKDGSFWVRGREIKIKRGQLGCSEVTLSREWGWSRNKLRRYLKWLESERQIAQEKIYKITTIITILLYDEYQNDTTKRQQTEQQKDNRRYNRRNTNNNVNNDNNVNKREDALKKHKYGEHKNVLLTDQEKEKLKEKFGKTKALKLVNKLSEYLAIKNVVYKSHYLVMLKWEREDKQNKEYGSSRPTAQQMDQVRRAKKLQQAQAEEQERLQNIKDNKRMQELLKQKQELVNNKSL